MTVNNYGYPINWVEAGNNWTTEHTFQYQSGNFTKIMTVFTQNGEIVNERITEIKYDDKKSPFHHCKTPKWYMIFLFDWEEFGVFNNNITEVIVESKTKAKHSYVYDSYGFPTKQTTTWIRDFGGDFEEVFTFTYITR